MGCAAVSGLEGRLDATRTLLTQAERLAEGEDGEQPTATPVDGRVVDTLHAARDVLRLDVYQLDQVHLRDIMQRLRR